MNRKKLSKIKEALRALRNSPQGISCTQLTSLALKLGRINSARQHPTYVRKADPTLPPLSIPAHRGDLKVRTACIIIEHLLDDVELWESFLSDADEDNIEESDE